MSVPTTFLLDAHGEARYVNNGVTRAEKLMEQIQTLSVTSCESSTLHGLDH